MRDEDRASFAHIATVFRVDRTTVSRAYADLRRHDDEAGSKS